MTRETLVRERSSHLLYRLIKDDIGQCHEDAAGALRLMSHAALNLAAELGTQAVQRSGESLVWLSLYAQWESGQMSAVELGQELLDRKIIGFLADSMVQRRLAKVEALRVPTVLHRAPRETHLQIVQSGQGEVDVLVELHQLDRMLQDALACDDAVLMNRLFSESLLLCAALELRSVDGSKTKTLQAASERLTNLFGTGDARQVSGLEILAEIENGEFEQVPTAFLQLTERSRRFELSLAQNMAHHGLLCAVRAALGFNSPSGNTWHLGWLDAFSGDDELAELARVLVEMRGVCHGYFSGALGIESLKPWVMYLRNGCMEFGESRGLTLREATGFAHYCLHLVNLCDLGSRGARVVSEETRRALMDIEDDLKEFALSGQRDGTRDSQVNLTAFERGRWKRRGDSAYIVDRLARLTGGWRAGVRPGPVGAPARLDSQVLVESQALMDEIVVGLNRANPGNETAAVGMMAAVLRNCTIHGAEFFEMMTLEEAFKVLSFGLAAARDTGGMDVNQPFWLDVRALLSGAERAQDAGTAQRQMLAQVLKRRPLDAFFSAGGESNSSGFGLMSRVVKAEDEAATIGLSFAVDAELSSLLELMNHSSSQSVRLRTMLETRLDELLNMNFGDIAIENVKSAPTKAVAQPGPEKTRRTSDGTADVAEAKAPKSSKDEGPQDGPTPSVS